MIAIQYANRFPKHRGASSEISFCSIVADLINLLWYQIAYNILKYSIIINIKLFVWLRFTCTWCCKIEFI